MDLVSTAPLRLTTIADHKPGVISIIRTSEGFRVMLWLGDDARFRSDFDTLDYDVILEFVKGKIEMVQTTQDQQVNDQSI